MKRKVFSVLGIALIVVALYFGTYLPYRKSTAIIKFSGGLENIRTVQQFFDAIGEVLKMPSPYGEEELARLLGDDLSSAIKSQKDPRIVEAFTAYGERILASFLEAGSSPSRSILVLASLNQSAWETTGDGRYAQRAEDLYLRCLKVSPRRPQCLYGLLRLYISGEKKKEALEVGEEILRYWPQDARVKRALKELENGK
jgi:hypothetical protein